jgi:hypothetical protein
MARLLTVLALVVLFPPAGTGQTAPASAPTSRPAIPPEIAPLLKYVPDDTHLVLIIPKLNELVSGVSAFGRAIGTEDLVITPDKLLAGPLNKRVGLVNTNGPLVLALSANSPDPLILAVLSDNRVLDPEGVTELAEGVRLLDLGENSYLAATRDGVAVIGRERGEVQRALIGRGRSTERLLQSAGPLLARHQLVIGIDVPPWQDSLRRKLDLVAQGAYMGLAAAGPDAAAAVQIWKWIFEQIEMLVGQADTYGVALLVDGQGVFVEDRARFQTSGPVAQYLQGIRHPERDLLRGLPAGPAAVVFAAEWEPPPGAESIDQALVKAVLRTESLRARIGEEKFDAALQRSLEAYRNLTGYSGVMAPGPEGRGMCFTGLYLTSDGPTLQRKMREVIELCPELMNAWGGMPAESVQRDRIALATGEADVYRFSLSAGNSQIAPALEALYGKDLEMLLAPHRAGVCFAMGPREEARRRIEALSGAQAPPLTGEPRIRAALARFSPQPQFLLLLDMPQIARVMLGMAHEMGVPAPELAAPDPPLPLAGLAFYVEGAELHSELFIPSAPLKFLINALQHAEHPGGEPY